VNSQEIGMHKHEGIVVVAFKPGQPASQVEADLELADIAMSTQVVRGNGEHGWAEKVNLHGDALALASELEEAGFSACICQGHHDWQPV
jgi:hypothetical protein